MELTACNEDRLSPGVLIGESPSSQSPEERAKLKCGGYDESDLPPSPHSLCALEEEGRTHKTSIPSTQVPPRDEVLHDEYVRYHSLVVAEGQAPDGCEYGTSEGVVVVYKTCDSCWSVGICVGAVGMYVKDTPVRDVLVSWDTVQVVICLSCYGYISIASPITL